MPLFLVTYVHPDPHGWKTHLGPHLEWIARFVDAGTLRASGPTDTGRVRSAALLFDCPDRRTLDAILAADPFVEHGQVSEMTIAQWDPIFGLLNSDSSQAGRDTREIIRAVLTVVEAAD